MRMHFTISIACLATYHLPCSIGSRNTKKRKDFNISHFISQFCRISSNKDAESRSTTVKIDDNAIKRVPPTFLITTLLFKNWIWFRKFVLDIQKHLLLFLKKDSQEIIKNILLNKVIKLKKQNKQTRKLLHYMN